MLYNFWLCSKIFRPRGHMFETSRRCSKSQGIHHDLNQAPNTSKPHVTQSKYLIYHSSGHTIANGARTARYKTSGNVSVVLSEFKSMRVQMSNVKTSSIFRRRCYRQGRESPSWVYYHVFEFAMQQTRFDVASAAPSILFHARYQLFCIAWPVMRLRTWLLYLTDVRVRRISFHGCSGGTGEKITRAKKSI